MTAFGLWAPKDLEEREELYARWAGAALAPTPELSLSEWAARKISLPTTEPVPGPLDYDHAPYLPGLLDLFTDPEVEEVTWVTSTQVGKSLATILLLGYCADHRRVPALYVGPDEDSAKAMNKSRMQPIFASSGDLAELLPHGHGNTEFEVKLLNDVALRFVTARSATKLAQWSVPVIIFDEFDKYPARAGSEADPIKLGTERLRWWPNRLIVKVTTPSLPESYGWRELVRAPAQYRFYVRCPHCREPQVLAFNGEQEKFRQVWLDGERELTVPGPVGRISWPKDENGHSQFLPEEIRARRLAWYECGNCTRAWGEHERGDILRGGEWRMITPGVPRTRVGVRLWAAYSTRLTWSDIAAEFLSTKDKPELLQNFVNSWQGWYWEERGEVPDEDALLKRQVVYAGGEGMRVGDRAENVLIDSGWDRPRGSEEEVIEDQVIGICDAWNFAEGAGVFQPSKGSSRPMSPPLTYNKYYYHDREGKPLRGRLSLHRFYPHYFKVMLHSRLQRAGGRGGFWLPTAESFGMVPEDALLLTAGVDVHKVWQYWTVWAWGRGFTGWMVACGRTELWEEVKACVLAEYPVAYTTEEASLRLTEYLHQLRGEELITDARGQPEWKATGLNHYLDATVLAAAAAFKHRMVLDTPEPEEREEEKPPEPPPAPSRMRTMRRRSMRRR